MIILENKLISYILIFLFSLAFLGFFNSNWYSLIFYQLLFLLFYAAKVNTNFKNWLIIILIIPIIFFSKKHLQLPQISMASNVFIGGENYKNSVFKDKLPKIIFDKLFNDYKETFPKSISAPDDNVYDKSVSQILRKSSETKYVEKINWNNRYQLQLGGFNNTRYNAYGSQQPKRELLPFFVRYSFPQAYSNLNSKFCWKGLGYVGPNLNKMEFNKLNCISFKNIQINNKNGFDIWLLETGKTKTLKAKLFLPLKYNLIFYLKNVLSFLSGTLILILLFKKINFEKALLFATSCLISFIFVIYFYPNFINKFVLFEGGNDGLLYVHFAHLISDSLSIGNLMSAFMGGEEVYDLMPFYRYIWIINYLLFEESPWMLFFIITFFPLVIFSIFNQLFNKKWAYIFLVFWFFIPIFEAFGFFHFYYVKLTIRGFGEPLSYLLFLSALSLLIKFESDINTIKFENVFIYGLLLSFSIGLRANILPACIVMTVFFFLINTKTKNNFYILYFLLGFSFVLIMPIHNYLFSGKFVPLTIAAYKDWNLGARPGDYLALFTSLLNFNFDKDLWNKIISHVGGEIKIYEVWYHLSILASIYFALIKKSPLIIRCVALSSLSLVLLLLFYHVGGRYSYLTWTLSLIVLSYWLKNVFFPIIKKNHKINAT